MCQEVAGEIPLNVPSTIVGNSDTEAKLFLASAQAAGRALARRPSGGSGWVDMIQQFEFQTAALQPQNGSIANTGAGGVAQVTGISTTGVVANTWAAFGTFVPSNTNVKSVDGPSQVTLTKPASSTGSGQFTFGQSDYALPSDFKRPIDNTFWDRSRFWSMRGPMSPQQWQLYKSSVIGKASIQRRFRFRNISGTMVLSIDPVPTDNGSYLVFEYVSTAWCKSSTGTLQPQWLADTDLGVLDEELLKLGIEWRMLKRLGMAYADELDEYDTAIDKALGSDGGAAILDLAPPDHLTLIGPWNIPETNFGNVVGS
jgi:hypothetical protein